MITCRTQPTSSSSASSARCWRFGCTRQFIGCSIKSFGEARPCPVIRLRQVVSTLMAQDYCAGIGTTETGVTPPLHARIVRDHSVTVGLTKRARHDAIATKYCAAWPSTWPQRKIPARKTYETIVLLPG